MFIFSYIPFLCMRLSSPIPIPLPDNADYALVIPSESQTFTEPFHSWPYVPYHMYKGLSLRFLDYIIYHHFLPESRSQSLCQVIVCYCSQDPVNVTAYARLKSPAAMGHML